MAQQLGGASNPTVPSSALGPEQVKLLLAASEEAKQFAYCPYSNYPVGAALLTSDGKIFSGCNIENACYPLGVCAETYGNPEGSVRKGIQKFRAIAIICNSQETFAVPCGACRQVLREFGKHWEIFLAKADGTHIQKTLEDLLPFSFGPENLKMV
ncbi:cytidine deaminase [Lacerta agilis]|uniref:cytidine deaminase n=1 Tax=Lacerta agilis TaxID=80427 RepID=UPI00141A241A|nr:cytidine deaminase [Lacerta agilis]